MATHVVKIEISTRKKFKYDKECLCVKRGDTIKWKLKNDFPYGIVIKALVSPLDWSYRMTAGGKWISAKVRTNAAPGLYPYGVGAFNGHELLFDDPEIIVRRPD